MRIAMKLSFKKRILHFTAIHDLVTFTTDKEVHFTLKQSH